MKPEINRRNRIWPVIRWVNFLVVGLMNTLLIEPEDAGTWKKRVGYSFLLLVLTDLVWWTSKSRWLNKPQTGKHID